MEVNDLIGFKVRVKMDVKDDYYWEDFSGVVHPLYKDARHEMDEAMNNPQLAGYEFDIDDVWMED